MDTLRGYLQDRDVERRGLEQKIQEVGRETQEAKKALEESLRDSNRYCNSLELISRYKLITVLFLDCAKVAVKKVVSFFFC